MEKELKRLDESPVTETYLESFKACFILENNRSPWYEMPNKLGVNDNVRESCKWKQAVLIKIVDMARKKLGPLILWPGKISEFHLYL